MRRNLVIVSGIIITLTILTNLFLPNYISFMVRNYLQKNVHAQKIEGSVQTHPSFMILSGKIDELSYKANSARLGQIQIENLTLKGNKIQISIPSLFTGALKIEKAQDFSLAGTISEKELQELIEHKLSKAKDIKVKITPETIDVNAVIPLFDNNISAHMIGKVYALNGSIFFKTQCIDVENNLLGKITLNKMENILLIDKNRLPFGARISKIEQEDGQILVEASMSKE